MNKINKSDSGIFAPCMIALLLKDHPFQNLFIFTAAGVKCCGGPTLRTFKNISVKNSLCYWPFEGGGPGVAFWFILRGASCFKVFPCSLSSCFFIPFSIVITSLGERKLFCVLLLHLFVCFVRASFCHFSLLLGVGDGCGLWLWHSLDFSINWFFSS